MARLQLRNIRKSFDAVEILHGVDLDVSDGEFVVFVGPSGCGKSTLLRLVCGLDDITSGTLVIDDEIVNDVPPAKRGIAMVFQSYALYPHMTVAQNMAYALKLAGVPRAEIDARVKAAAATLRLDTLLHRKPRQLSGGQRQRVAIGRAIVREPRIFLFDEPLSNLDAALRVDMRAEIAALKARLGVTMFYVTHDQVEAMTLADKIVVMNAGRIEQVGAPLDLYRAPANRFVARFIGSPRMNMIPAALLDLGGAEIGVRPEHVTIASGGKAALEGEVRMIEHLGSDLFAHVKLDRAEELVIARLDGQRTLKVGERIGLAPDIDHLHRFDAEGRRLTADESHRSAA
ncbi:MAG: ABC transporter ATP-binding protein [Rhizobiales bacterium 65-9]|nr:sn-glycerol-3-phosphate ABC transporter ATP-binding protein UgpC [Hyphomicrobiales bacterium]OJY35497.1 MAG: ABC transporter ATP-binding protein [Rhizobiales bacterium 65-9]